MLQLPAESQVNNNATQNSLTEEQRAEAETLKTDGQASRTPKSVLVSEVTSERWTLFLPNRKRPNESGELLSSCGVLLQGHRHQPSKRRLLLQQVGAASLSAWFCPPCWGVLFSGGGAGPAVDPCGCSCVAELQPTVNWGTTLERCRTASVPSASTRTTAKPTGGWGTTDPAPLSSPGPFHAARSLEVHKGRFHGLGCF